MKVSPAVLLLSILFLSGRPCFSQLMVEINGEDRDTPIPETVIGSTDSLNASQSLIELTDTVFLSISPFDSNLGQLESVQIDYSGRIEFSPTFSLTTGPGQENSTVDIGLLANANLTGPLGLSSSDANVNLGLGFPFESTDAGTLNVGSGSFGGRLVLRGDSLESFLGQEDAQLPLALSFAITASTSNGQLIINPDNNLTTGGPRLTASTFSVSFVTTAVPEPSGAALLGLLGLARLATRRRLA